MSARFSVVDEIFLRTHRGWGDPVVMQGLWRCAERVDAALVEEVGHALANGPLGRRVVRPRIPLARPRFVVDASEYPIEYRTVAAAALLDWADERAGLDVDPESGPGWRLSVARLDDGGTAVSLVCSHVVADARGLVMAIENAMTGRTVTARPVPRTSDLWDALTLIARVGAKTAVAVAGLVAHPSRRKELQRPKRGSEPAPVSCKRVIADIDASEWSAAAARGGGSPNSLFLSVVADVARSGTEPVVVSVPMDVRTSGGVENAIAMAEVTVRAQDTTGHILQACRSAYEAPPMSSPAGFPEELLQVVPDRWAHALANAPGERDVLCSNIGSIPDGMRWLGPHEAIGVATRAVHPHRVSTRTRVFAFVNEFDGRYTLALESTVVPDLQRRIVDVLTGRGLHPRLW